MITRETVLKIVALAADERGDPNIREVAIQKFDEVKKLYPELVESIEKEFGVQEEPAVQDEWAGVDPMTRYVFEDVRNFDVTEFLRNIDHWDRSKKGNWYVEHNGWLLIVFSYRKGGFGWRISRLHSRGGKEEWSSKQRPYASPEEAARASLEVSMWEPV